MRGQRFEANSSILCFSLSRLKRAVLMLLSMSCISFVYAQNKSPANDNKQAKAPEVTEFNTDVMDVEDRGQIDISHFSRAGYVMPGDYDLMLNINGHDTREVNVSFLSSGKNQHNSLPCITPTMINLFGLKEETVKKLSWHDLKSKRCLNEESLPGMTSSGDLSTGSLKLNIPQAYLEYTDPDWDPPSRWDDGINGLLLDYSLNASRNHTLSKNSFDTTSLSGNGTAGINIGPWRLRSEWQASRYNGHGYSSQDFDFSRFYLYRALPSIGAKLVLGESDLDSSLFDSFRYTGASLITDDNMLPPNLQGYAPEVTGVARTNAKITISQQGRVIYESQVAAGPFRIQELSSAVSGTLDVKIEEQDGSIQSFQVDTATIPYLTRPGMVRYKVYAGRPTDWKHHIRGSVFSSGEFSWGVTNGWSLFGGSIISKDYASGALGLGRDLLSLGAVSLDVTQSSAVLPHEGKKLGRSYRLSYSKRFEEIESQVTFAGYRFSDANFLSMNDYLDERYRNSDWGGVSWGRQKELYTISVSKAFPKWNMNLYGNYNYKTYWNRPSSNRYSLSLSKYLDVSGWKNISLNITGYKSEMWGVNDNGVFANISIPWNNGNSLTYSGQNTTNGTTQTVGWYDNIDGNNSYNIQAGTGPGNKTLASGYLSHSGDSASSTVNLSYSEGSYSSAGLSLQGGITATRYGFALHPGASTGGTRLMIDTGDATGVPLDQNGVIQRTNFMGIGVLGDINSYWRNSVGVDINSLGENMEVTHPLTELTLTEGAIGYRKIEVLQGRKLMAIVRFSDGEYPAFGSTIWRGKLQTGVVDDGGNIWLAGVKPGVTMEIRDNETPVCRIRIPKQLPPENSGESLLLTCVRI